MAYVSVPKDLNAVKTKVIFNLTKRQLICFSLGGLVGLPTFLILKDINATVAVLLMIGVMFPFFMFAMYEKHGQPLEVLIKQIYMLKFGTAKERPYKTQNFYSLLEQQYNLNKEVSQIVKKSSKINESGKKANRNRPRSA